MTLLDTNVPIGAFDPDSPHGQWARQTIADAVAIDGAAIDAVSLADFVEPDLRVPDAPPRCHALRRSLRCAIGLVSRGLRD